MLIRKSTNIIIMGIALLIFSAQSAISADVAKIGIVNFQKIFDISDGGKAAKKEIKAAHQRMDTELKKKADEIKTLEQSLKQDAGILTPDAQEEKKWELDRKTEEIKALKKRYDRKIQEIQMKLVNQVRKEVHQIIQEYAKKEGFLLIIEDINTVYAPPSISITDEIIKIYNKKNAKK